MNIIFAEKNKKMRNKFTKRIVILLIVSIIIFVTGFIFLSEKEVIFENEAKNVEWRIRRERVLVQRPAQTGTYHEVRVEEPEDSQRYEASWYSQDNLCPSRKAIAGDNYGVAVNWDRSDYRLGDCVVLRYGGRTVVFVVSDYCAGCLVEFPGRMFDLQKEGFYELSGGRLDLGVIDVAVKEVFLCR